MICRSEATSPKPVSPGRGAGVDGAVRPRWPEGRLALSLPAGGSQHSPAWGCIAPGSAPWPRGPLPSRQGRDTLLCLSLTVT